MDGALSPAMESDYYHGRSPPTPTDSQIWPTFPNHYDNWDSHSQFYPQCTSLAPDCVKLGDLYPYQDSYEDNLVRSLSMSSDDCDDFSSNGEQWSPSELSQMSQQMSPVAHLPEVKEEIHIPEPNFTPVYPAIETDDEAHSADEVEHTRVKVEDEDEEYQPRSKPKRANAHASRAGKAQKRTSSSAHTLHATKRVKTESNDSNTISNIATVKASLKGAKRNFPCKECRDIVFKDENGLQKHIKTQHTRPFICVFDFAGCTSTFASKNEWKRHCASQHLLLNYWLCQQELCAKVTNSYPHISSNKQNDGSWQAQCGGSTTSCNGGDGDVVPTLPNGAIFNRKDLYTQHLRRMHVPPNVKKQVKQKKTVPEWEDNVRAYQEGAHRTRCHLPSRMDCPAPGCRVVFEGPNAWDERMEHVAKHLDKAGGLGDSAVESPFSIGGENHEDTTLIAWATRPEVDIIRKDDKGKWVLHNPLRPTGHPRKGVATAAGDEDEDAEGEEFDE
ncbi:hypothetical protein SLS62_007143 [Diatrype stigma]|uniref:C2H2-type domain-containing protein n=1 Tax=Diatrype stigma TaxID=117547 RepID=A0AAN9URB8_9PEZI